MNKDQIRQWWLVNSDARARAQTVKEWLREYETGKPEITVRLVKGNPK